MNNVHWTFYNVGSTYKEHAQHFRRVKAKFIVDNKCVIQTGSSTNTWIIKTTDHCPCIICFLFAFVSICLFFLTFQIYLSLTLYHVHIANAKRLIFHFQSSRSSGRQCACDPIYNSLYYNFQYDTIDGNKQNL